MFIIDILMQITDFIWGMPMLLLTFGVALYLSIRLKFFQFTNFGYAMKNTFGKIFKKAEGDGDVSPFQACCTALASTLGVGNIAGVSVAIASGGPGAIFWMWFVAMLGLIVKFAEITLGIKYREKDPVTGKWHGGFYWYVKNGLGEKWKPVAVFWAFLLSIAMLFGAAVQINAVVGAVNTYFNVSPLLIGIVSAVMIGAVLIGGLKTVSKFAEVVVPFMAMIYVGICIFILSKYLGEIPAAFALIFKSAFSPVAATGGFAGSTVALAIRWGLARGVFSNEAGTGTAPLVHSSASVNHPVKQGLWGIVEVFVDTIVVCTMTALVVIVTGVWQDGASGAALTTQAIGVGFGSQITASIILTVIISFFAFTTALVNLYYGEVCVIALGGAKVLMGYRIVGCIFAIIGAVGALGVVWGLFDLLYGIVAMLNLVVLFVMRNKIKETLVDFIERRKTDTWN